MGTSKNTSKGTDRNPNSPLHTIPKGVYSRYYPLSSGQSACVAYHTPSQSVALFENDSAEVWWRIFQAKGDCSGAFYYILENGTFDGNPECETQNILDDFLGSLKSSHLLVSTSCNELAEENGFKHIQPIVREAVDVAQNTELEIGQFMADHHVLYSLVLELTYRCNESCVHCYLPTDTRIPELSVGQIRGVLEEFSALGGLLLQLTGGELFYRKDIVEILELVKRLGFVTSITSNLTLLNDDILAALVALQPRSVGCSIYAATPELHDTVTTIRGSFEKSVNAIRRLRAANIPVIIKAPLLRSTAPGWRGIEKLANELDCEYQFDLSITAKNDGGLSPISHRVEDMAILQDIFASRYYKLFTHDEAMSSLIQPSPEAGLCGAGASGLAVSPDGTIRPCIGLNVALGSALTESLSKVWNQSAFFAEFGSIRLLDIPECNVCPDFQYCSRCPGAWHAEHGSFVKHTAYACTLARAWASTQRQKKKNQEGGEKNEISNQS